MNIIKRVWKDPVGSNVIAGLIIFIILSLATALILPVRFFVISIFNYLLQNPFVFSTLILIVVVFMLLRNKSNSSRIFFTPLRWLSNLSDEQLTSYRFLFWFPLHHVLKTPKYYLSSETIDHIPEIRDLIENRVLKIIIEDVIHYSIEIDKDCYKYFDELFLKLPEVDRGKQLFATLRSTDFIYIFLR